MKKTLKKVDQVIQDHPIGVRNALLVAYWGLSVYQLKVNRRLIANNRAMRGELRHIERLLDSGYMLSKHEGRYLAQ